MIAALSEHLALGSLLSALQMAAGGYDLVDHWQQGEFHHDVVLRVPEGAALPGTVVIAATNCATSPPSGAPTGARRSSAERAPLSRRYFGELSGGS